LTKRKRKLFAQLFAMASAMIFASLRNLRSIFTPKQMLELTQDIRGCKSFMQILICQRRRQRRNHLPKKRERTISIWQVRELSMRMLLASSNVSKLLPTVTEIGASDSLYAST